jgi:hypothetical protein
MLAKANVPFGDDLTGVGGKHAGRVESRIAGLLSCLSL